MAGSADDVHEIPYIGPSQVNGQDAALLTRLSVADAPFVATGIARVKVTRGSTERLLAIPIKSVPLEDIESAVAHLRPKIPTYRDQIKGKWVTIFDEANEGYQQKLAAYQRALSNAWVLMALDIDVIDSHGQVVWSKDNTTQRLEEAVAALKAMGLVESQLVTIFRAVQSLTQDVAEAVDRD